MSGTSHFREVVGALFDEFLLCPAVQEKPWDAIRGIAVDYSYLIEDPPLCGICRGALAYLVKGSDCEPLLLTLSNFC